MNAAPDTKPLVPFWRIQLGDAEVEKIKEAVLGGRLSQGALTAEFEKKLGQLLGAPYVVATTSCSMALYLALSALDIGPGDEVIVPNRTFIATAHAVLLRGASVRLVDARKDSSLIDESQIEAAVTPRTKAIIPVHLNGNAVDMAAVSRVAAKHGLRVIEDAAQAFLSRNERGCLGTQSDMGCFSLGPTKFITTGQGGFVVTKNKELYDKMCRFRNHGVDNVFSADFQSLGFNLKFNDVLASIGLVQLGKIEEKKKAHAWFYEFYRHALKDVDYLRLMPVAVESGRLPLWVEALAPEREKLIALLEEQNIQARPFTPDLHLSRHMKNEGRAFPNSKLFSDHGLWLPCGPDLPRSAYDRTLETLRALKPQMTRRLPAAA